MLSIGERNFQILMGGLFVGAVALENALPRLLPAWNPPQLGFLAFVIGLVWIGRYVAWRDAMRTERDRVIRERLERIERQQRALEDDLRQLYRRPLGPS